MNSHYINNILRYIFITFRFLLVAMVCFLIGMLFYYGLKFAYPFLIAIIISFFINPLVNFLEKKARIHRGLATFIVIFLIFAAIIGIATIIVVQLINGLTYLNVEVPSHIQTLTSDIQTYFFSHILPVWERITHLISTLNQTQQLAIQENINRLGQKLASNLSRFGTNVITFLTNFIVSLPNVITVLIFVFLATFFITKDWYKLGDYFGSKLPESALKSSLAIYDDLRRAFMGFVRAHLTLISITTFIVMLGLIILRVDHPITIAFLAGLADFLPYLGTGTVFLPWIIYSYFSGHFYMTIGLSVLYGIVIVQRQIMEPKIISSNIGLSPLPTLVAIFISFKLFGLIGLIIGPTTLIVFKTLSHANVFYNLWNYIIGARTLPK
jgi:sporulation integral membrane protein YtvI